MTTNLPVAGLEFKAIKESFQNYLKGIPEYKDWNFEGSGISRLIDILSYNTHYLGYYVKMLMDESFVDSAHTREALLSIAKRSGYVVRGKRSARADVKLSLTMDISQDPLSQNILVPAGLTFTGANTLADSRTYNIIDDVVMYDRVLDGSNVTYTSPEFTIYEGSLEEYRFLVDSSNLNQRFVIRDRDIDATTIRVDVAPFEGSLDVEQYQLADDIFELNGDSKVFFITTNEDGLYQVFFGDGVFGIQPPNGAVITCRYISTNGESGNGAKSFTFNPEGFGLAPDFSTEVISIASGGMEEEGTESMRFTIPHHFRRQNRIVTESDYRAVLLSEFRNIDSLNVWGGERNGQREYGKIFISIKPKFADSLTASARNEIKNSVLSKYGAVGIDVEFVDPQFIEVDVTIYGKADLRKTNEGLRVIEGRIISKMSEFNANVLSRFDTLFSDVALLDFVKANEPSIITLFTTKVLRKRQAIIHRSTSTNFVEFSNEITPATVKSTEVVYAGDNCYLSDDGVGGLWLRKADGSKKLTTAQGQVNYATGVISFTLPTFAAVKGYEGLYSGVIEFSVTPRYPDVNTSLNNIVRISKTKASLTA